MFETESGEKEQIGGYGVGQNLGSNAAGMTHTHGRRKPFRIMYIE